jgi:hypothetical protein
MESLQIGLRNNPQVSESERARHAKWIALADEVIE